MAEKTSRPTGKSGSARSAFVEDALAVAMETPDWFLSDVPSWHAHIPFARVLVSLLKPKLIAELGVHKGDSLLSMADALKTFGIKGKIIGVDTWQGDDHAGSYGGDAILADLRSRAEPLNDFIEFKRCLFDDALADVADGSVDLLHIDGLHTYEAVKHDFETWRQKLSARGVVMFHDTIVTTSDFGVYRFWDEIRDLGPSWNFPYGNGLGLLCLGKKVPKPVLDLVAALNADPDAPTGTARLFQSVGEAYEGRSLLRILPVVREDGENNRLAVQTSAMSEITRLNDEIVALHGGYGKEIDRLNGVMQTLQHELEELHKGYNTAFSKAVRKTIGPVNTNEEIAMLRGEKRRLEYEMAKQVQAAEQKAEERIRQLQAEVDKLSKRSLRGVGAGLAYRLGRKAYRLAPLPEPAKRSVKLFAIRHFGRFLGLVPATEFDMGSAARVPLRRIDETSLALSRAATGKPSNLPERSVSIVVPVYNKLEYTLQCIEAVKRNTREIDHELIIVDDCSTDATEATLSVRDDIIYVRNETNLGFIGSCNAGSARASKAYVCYLNNDTEVAPYWLSSMVNTFEMHDGVGLVGSKLIYPDGRLQEAGGIIWDDFSGWNWGRLQDANNPIYDYARRTDYCSGASILVPKALVDAMGGFDTEFTPAYGEDSDMAFKIRSLGLATLYQPLSRVIHYEGISSGTDITQGVKAYQVVNAEKLKERWAPVLPHQGRNGIDPEKAADRGVLGRILVIDQITPEPDKDAGSITALEIMRGFRDLGYKVTFIPCSNFTHIPHYTDALAALGIESVLYPWCASVKDHLASRPDHYDAVVLFRAATADEHLDTVRKLAPRAKIIFHNSDLHFLREERARSVDNPDIAEKGRSAEATKAKELGIIGASALTIVHSHFEKDLLAELLPETPVEVFPWIYEPRGAGKLANERQDIVFVGGYRHHPNVDAVVHYVENIAPLVRKAMGAVRFRVIGSHPPAEFDTYARNNPDIVIDGFVEDIEPVLFGARMMVAPLRYGAGLKGKIVTAMAHGLPVVTTSVGAEGMALTDGENVLIADDPADMAAAIRRLHEDDALWARLSEGGLAFVAATTSRHAGYRIMRRILDRTGLPTLPEHPAPQSSASYTANLGTPALLSTIETLASAFETRGERVLVVPDAHVCKIDGWTVTGASGMNTPAPHVCALVDLADDTALAGLVGTLKDRVTSDGNAEVLFVPPRLGVEGNRHVMTHALRGGPVDDGELRLPPQIRHRDALSPLGDAVTWRADSSLTGFPGVMIAKIEFKRGAGKTS